ncbi:hypothetical protein HYPSUDRAFT_215483 [Hypholoma sublateritium FD-334 SS-4]|uniref:Uncharacterized protein n=1 Tax=Hypholoma sublateritium (strain FD-334 SS-4) TaxID=945553 RepID=A0A0D2NVW3_HYPSF|nr:hypothetical protein HYPSUDRAFT_215483 [Hypholoma sublateritium FD-334 SS-4]
MSEASSQALEARLRKISVRKTLERFKIAMEFERIDEGVWDETKAYLQAITRNFLDARKTWGNQRPKVDNVEQKLRTDKSYIFGHHDVLSSIRLTCAMDYIHCCLFPRFRAQHGKRSIQPRVTTSRAAKHSSSGRLTRRHTISPDFRTPTPPRMFAPKPNNSASENSKKSPRPRFKKPPGTSQPLRVLPSTRERQAEGNNPGPSAITASNRRSSFGPRFAESESTGSSLGLEFGNASEARTTARRVHQAREVAAACRIHQPESRNLDAPSNMPTPQSSQPRINSINDDDGTLTLPSLQMSLSGGLIPSALKTIYQDQPRPMTTLQVQAHDTFSSAVSTSSPSSSGGVGAVPSDFIVRFLACCLPPLTHLLPALAHARLTEARIRGIGARWAVGDIEEFLRKKLGALRDANGALVDDIDITLLAHHFVFCFGEGSHSRWDGISVGCFGG